MSSEKCPDREVLQQLLLGKMLGPEAERLEEHLLLCDDCSVEADSVSSTDELISAIRACKIVDGDDGVLTQVIERAKQLRSRAETVETDETIFTAKEVRKDPAKELVEISAEIRREIDFLAPGLQADEIGRLGEYRVLEVLGIGGMGVVFRAEDPRLKREVALKAMKPAIAASKSARERFVREAQATAAIDHHHIVQIYQVGEDRSIPFFAMQFLRGESLQQRLEREERIAQRDVVRIGREVAAGLAAAHERGLIHRDIKPDNIWLEQKSGWAKILDFGLARTHDDGVGLTQSGMVLGTPKYMAPEQAAGEAVDFRCDLFSLGSVLYHLASGETPFQRGNVTATLLAVSQVDYTPLEKVRPDLHPGLARLISRLLSKDRESRPASAADVAAELARIETELSEQPVAKAKNEKLPSVTESSDRMSPLARTAGNAGRSIVFGGTMAVVLAIFGWLYFAGVFLKIENENGTLIVKVSAEEFTTSARGSKVLLKNAKTDETITIDMNSSEQSKRLAPGSYVVLETESGIRTETNHFTIGSGEDKVVEVTWVPKAVAEPSKRTEYSDIPDRRAAEWVLSISDHPYTQLRVNQDGFERTISNVELQTIGLPAKPFQLTGVNLKHNKKITDEGMANLRGCKNLTLLNLGYTAAGDAGVAHVKDCCQNLTALHLNGQRITDAGLAYFKDCRELTVLTLQNIKVTGNGLDNFKNCKKLTDLFLGGTRLPRASLECFRGCRDLQYLDVRNTYLNARELVYFKDCAKLHHVDVSRVIGLGNEQLSFLQGCKELTFLNLAYTQVNDDGLAFLKQLEHLKYVNLAKTGVSEDFVKSLRASLPQCEIALEPLY